ncbi:MAG: stage III sporulation protein AB [Oscillospiraceae bacterium]|nr:stage III sporulation protein AB [Oscillospiraceae bacterium]
MPAEIGFVCIVVGCGGLGLTAFLRLEARVKLLSAFSMLANRLGGEIGFRLTPLPEMPDKFPALKPFWDKMDYQPYGEETYSEAWSRSVADLDLPVFDRALLTDMGEILGRYDADNQVKALESLRKQLDISLTEAKEKRGTYGRLYALAGVLGGLILAVVMI